MMWIRKESDTEQLENRENLENPLELSKRQKNIFRKQDKNKLRMGLKIKDSWTVYTTVTKRKDDGHFIDIMGVRIYRQHITIRRRVFLRVRRSYKKAQSLVKQRKKIPVWLARKCMSYKGILDHTDSYNIKRRYNANKTIQICKGVISHEIKITGKDTPYIYRVHQKNIGWTDWTFNGNWAGTKGKGLQIEAIEIMAAKFLVNPHVQNRGWLGERACENIIGITGHNLRLEAFKIDPLNMTIKAKAHIQGIGWKDYGQIDKNTVIGTVGENKRIECLCFKGDFEYRVHIQNSGWTDWTKADGVATLGTVGQALRIEAIQFK